MTFNQFLIHKVKYSKDRMGFTLDFLKLNNVQRLKILEFIMCYDLPNEISLTNEDKQKCRRTKWMADFDNSVTYYMGACWINKNHEDIFHRVYKTLNIEEDCIVKTLYPSILIKNTPFYAITYEDLELPDGAKFRDKDTNKIRFSEYNEEPKLKREFETKENIIAISKWLYRCPMFMITRIFSDPGSKFLQDCYMKTPNCNMPINIDTIMERFKERTLGYIMNMVDGYYACDTRNKDEEVAARKDTEGCIKIILEEYKTFVRTAIIESYTLKKQ